MDARQRVPTGSFCSWTSDVFRRSGAGGTFVWPEDEDEQDDEDDLSEAGGVPGPVFSVGFGLLFGWRVEIGIVFGQLFDEGIFRARRHAEVLAGLAVGFHRPQNAGAADGRVLDPFHKFEVELFLGFFFITFETGFLDFDTTGVDMATMYAGDVLGYQAELFPAFFKFFGGFLVAVHHQISVIEGKHTEEGLGQAVGGVGEVFGIGGQFALLFEDLAMMEPVAIAAVFPFINILAFEGTTIKVLGQNGFDLGHLVKGAGKVFGGVTVIEGEVDAVAEGTGEAGDFAVAVDGTKI